MAAPKLFISYSWSNPEHEQWVLELAVELKESGVDAIIDKWKLKEGHDAVQFMETMVTDPDIKKVLIVSDAVYAAKADGRDGGVGTETQIISKEVYDDQEQNKFVVAVAEKDANGKAFLPTYYKSRIYIDLCEPEKYTEEFEKLLRWVFDKPLYVEPEIGNRPSFLDEGESISLGTTVTYKRAMDAIKNGRAYARGALDEYLNSFVENFERFRIENPEGECDDAVVKSIEDFLPYRNEAIQLLQVLCRYSMNDGVIQRIHGFFESLVPYLFRPEGSTGWGEWDFDNYLFIVHELFLSAVAILIKSEQYDQANFLMEQEYYSPVNSRVTGNEIVDFRVFRDHMKSLEHRNSRQSLGRTSLRADFLKKRCLGTGIEFGHLMQADLVLFLRAELRRGDDRRTWWPETLVYLKYSTQSFEIFARSESRKYFDRVKCLLAIESPNQLKPLLLAYRDGERRLLDGNLHFSSLLSVLNYERLAKKP